MARPGRTESASLPIWLKLSEADAAQLEQVLARPEFAGWTRAEWCLEIIQTALRYYARRPAAERGHDRAAARPPAAEPPPEPPAVAPTPESPPGAPEPAPAAAAKPTRAAPKPRRAAARAKPAAPRTERPAPKRAQPERAQPERAQPERAPGPAAARPEPPPAAPEPKAAPEPTAAPEAGQDIAPPVAEELEPLAWQDCSHPAEARDYQTGTCGACGAILWD
jgi:hypothetical protein